jgi:hypothetical protein
LLDRAAFAVVGDKLTHYALDIAMRKWSSATKILRDNIKDGLELLDFEPSRECKSTCELPIRFGLPCKHWLYKAFVDDVPIPLSLFHPHWLLDGPAVLHELWVISWDPALDRLEQESLAHDMQQQSSNKHTSDRYSRRGKDLIMEAAFAAIEKHKSLPAGQAENFASKFKIGTDKLAVTQDKLAASFDALLLTLLEPLVEPNVRQFPSSRKRAMTGREAAEQEEQDKARQCRRAQNEHDENSFWATQMVAETQLRHSQRETQLSALSQLSKTPSVKLSSSEDSDSDSSTESSTDNDDPNHEPCRLGRAKRPTCDAASQASQDRAAALAKAGKGKGKSKRVRKAKLMNTSQLLDEFTLD